MTTNTTTETKTCRVCGLDKPLTGIFWGLSGAGGFRHLCKDCRREQARATRRANRKRYAERSRKWRKKHPEYMPAYTKANRSAITSKEQERRHTDPEYYARHLESARAYRARNREKINRNRALSRLVGGLLSADEYAALHAKQNGACAICGETEAAPRLAEGHKRWRILCVDHNHSTGKARGLLCYRCNSAIGLLKDSSEILRRAANYIDHHHKG